MHFFVLNPTSLLLLENIPKYRNNLKFSKNYEFIIWILQKKNAELMKHKFWKFIWQYQIIVASNWQRWQEKRACSGSSASAWQSWHIPCCAPSATPSLRTLPWVGRGQISSLNRNKVKLLSKPRIPASLQVLVKVSTLVGTSVAGEWSSCWVINSLSSIRALYHSKSLFV